MRITFVLPIAAMGGGVRVVSIYAKFLAARGHDVLLVSPPPRDPPLGKKVKSLLKGRGWPSAVPAPKSHLDSTGLRHHVLDRYRPVTSRDVPDADVVIATWWETAEWVNALGKTKGAKVYFVQHHEVFPYLPVERCHATYKFPMHKIVIARWLKDVMRNLYEDDVVDLVPNSVDRTQFYAEVRGKQSIPTVGFLYASVPSKGVNVALAAIRQVQQKIPNLRLVCFGSEPEMPTVPLPAGVNFYHSPPQNEIRNLYAQCDAWIAASTSEGFNLPAIEAMACRTPLVSTKAGWPEEVIQTGKNGALADVNDVDGLARGLDWILTCPEQEWREVSQRAYDTACTGSWNESASQFEAALLHACRRSTVGEIAGKHSVVL